MVELWREMETGNISHRSAPSVWMMGLDSTSGASSGRCGRAKGSSLQSLLPSVRWRFAGLPESALSLHSFVFYPLLCGLLSFLLLVWLFLWASSTPFPLTITPEVSSYPWISAVNITLPQLCCFLCSFSTNVADSACGNVGSPKRNKQCWSVGVKNVCHFESLDIFFWLLHPFCFISFGPFLLSLIPPYLYAALIAKVEVSGRGVTTSVKPLKLPSVRWRSIRWSLNSV